MTGDVAAVRHAAQGAAPTSTPCRATASPASTGRPGTATPSWPATLIVAGANVRATTRFGAITPLHLAAERGCGADRRRARQGRRRRRRAHQHRRDAADVRGRARATPRPSTALLDAGAELEAKETEREQTPLIFAAAANRVDGGEAAARTRRQQERRDQGDRPDGAQRQRRESRRPQPRRQAPRRRRRRGAAARPTRAGAAAGRATPGLDRGYLINEQVHTQGGMTPLLFAARQGYTDVAAGAARRRRRRQPAEGRRPGVGAAHRDRQRPLRPGGDCCSTAAPTRTWPPRTASRRSTPPST